MNIVIFANGERGLEVYKSLLKNNFQISALITNKKNNIFFKRNIPESSIHNFENINKERSLNLLKKFEADLFIVAGFSQIFKKEILKIPKLGTINLHAGKLPHYRGGSPLNWQLINCEKKAGISVIIMDEGIDTGNILAEAEFKINDDDDIQTLHAKANKIFPKITLESIIKLNNGNKGKCQDETNACYWHQRSDIDGKVDFRNLTATQVHFLIRALSKPYPGAWAIYKDKKVIFRKAILPSLSIKGTPGRIVYLNGNGPYILCKDRAILINEYSVSGNTSFKLINQTYLN